LFVSVTTTRPDIDDENISSNKLKAVYAIDKSTTLPDDDINLSSEIAYSPA
jgi:hypothetical protein